MMPWMRMPGQTWAGLLRHLTLTQIYTDDVLTTYLHPGLSQMWSLAVELSFYAVLPLLAYPLVTRLCGGHWRPGRLLAALGVVGALSPLWLLVLQGTDWLPNSAGMWLPAHLGAFAGGMALAVLQTMGVRCRAAAALPASALAYAVVATPVGDQAVTKAVLYALIAMLVLAPLALGERGWWARLTSSAPLVWLGGISYGDVGERASLPPRAARPTTLESDSRSESDSSLCAPSTTTISSTGERASASSTAGRSSRCLTPP